MRDFILVTGSANAPLAAAVAEALGTTLAPCRVERFPDGEVSVELGESVRRREVVLIQPTSPPVNDNLIELALLADACRRAAAARITAIVPYFGYARADRRKGRRAPVSARSAATLLEGTGIAHLVTVDAHTPPLEGFFSIPTDDVSATAALAGRAAESLPRDAVVVAPDLGAVARARDWSRRLQLPMALCLKQRLSGREVETSGVVGDVAGRTCLLVDDMISTGGTVAAAAAALRDAGAREVSAVVATHAVFAPGVDACLAGAGVSRVMVTDTVSRSAGRWTGPPAITTVSVVPLLATVIERLEAGASLRELL